MTPSRKSLRLCLADRKLAGKPIAGNRHDGFEVAGAATQLTVRLIEALGAADKAANLERGKFFFCQLPVFGRVAHPVRAKATKHDKPGCKNLSCPAEILASGRSELGGEQTRRP